MAATTQQPKLIFTDKLVVYDDIAGKYFREYDDKVLLFAPELQKSLKYIRLKYNYIFTGNYQLKRYIGPQIYNRFKFQYEPILPDYYYIYNEIYKTDNKDNKFNLAFTSMNNYTVLTIGTEYGLIEYLSHNGNKYKSATYIATNYIENKLEAGKQEILHQMYNNNIEATVITKPLDIYKLLEIDNIEPSDVYTYNNIEYVKHFELMFSHTHTISNIIGIISGLKYTKLGGIFIIHMQSIINKTNADLYLLAKKYFKTATLFMAECANEFKQTGTWAIFTGFTGIPTKQMDNLLSIVDQIKEYYPNGVHDSQVYDPAVLKKCWTYGRYFNASAKKIPYITGFFDNGLDDKIYTEVIDFNNIIYERKLAFCDKVEKAMKTIKVPDRITLPTPIQVKKSIEYLKKWSIPYKLYSASSIKQDTEKPYTYLFLSNSFIPESVELAFNRRGNWVPYTDKTFKAPVDFLYIDGKNIDNKEYYKIKSNLKSLVGDSKHEIVYKDNLYKNLIRNPAAKSFLPNTLTFSIRNTTIPYLNRFKKYFKPGKPYICKAVKGGSGYGIITTDKFNKFLIFMREYYDRMITNPEKFKQYDWVLQEYISNPWLVNGKKMHLRQIMVYQPGDKPSYYMYMGEFALAEKPYIKGDWSNKGIHDTHFKNGIGFEWPFEMNFTMDQYRYVMGQFDYIYACILSIMKGKGECYNDSKNCFELLGLDFMITDDLRVILIEVNARMGMTPSPWFTNVILVSLLKYVIDDYYPPKYVQQEAMKFYPIKEFVRDSMTKLKRRNTKKRFSIAF